MSEKSDLISWKAAALARLSRVPEGFMRDLSRQRIEDYVRNLNENEVTLVRVEEGLELARKSMESAMGAAGEPAAPPFMPSKEVVEPLEWSQEALSLLETIPMGMSREMTKNATNAIAAKQGVSQVDAVFLKDILDIFQGGSEAVTEGLPWEADARSRLDRIPLTVRGMLIQEIEGSARRANASTVTLSLVEDVFATWGSSGRFHLNPDDPRH